MSDFPGGSDSKISACNAGDLGLEPRKIPWKREWQPTPVFSPGESHGQRSLVGYNPWGHKELISILSTLRLLSMAVLMHVAHVNLYTLSEDTQKNPEYCRESGRESLPFEGKISKGDPPIEDFPFGEHIPQFHIPHPCSTDFTR